MKIFSGSTRNKLMVACALVAAAVLATPAAMAHDRYYGHGDRAGGLLGALIVGAVIGGVVASANSHDDRYYYDSGYYAPQPYPYASGYYGYNAYPSYPAYSSYPAYGYGGGYYGSGVNVGVYYSGGRRGYDRGYYRGSNGYYGGSHGWRDHGDHDRGSRGYGHDRSGGHYYSHYGH